MPREAKNLELLHSEPRILRVLLEVGWSRDGGER